MYPPCCKEEMSDAPPVTLAFPARTAGESPRCSPGRRPRRHHESHPGQRPRGAGGAQRSEAVLSAGGEGTGARRTSSRKGWASQRNDSPDLQGAVNSGPVAIRAAWSRKVAARAPQCKKKFIAFLKFLSNRGPRAPTAPRPIRLANARRSRIEPSRAGAPPRPSAQRRTHAGPGPFAWRGTMAMVQTRRRRGLILLAAGLALGLGAGCNDLSPSLVKVPPPVNHGEPATTHAKPPALGYLGTLETAAYRIEVRPLEQTSPVRTQQVLVATVT